MIIRTSGDKGEEGEEEKTGCKPEPAPVKQEGTRGIYFRGMLEITGGGIRAGGARHRSEAVDTELTTSTAVDDGIRQGGVSGVRDMMRVGESRLTKSATI
ncbi:hypothetical protein RRG08_000935 [Elysia crispata]|uniref:Uncharacterized protein n=1 Tax=Elysia crispata TaxID=231223 RepID=A0AAE1AFM1_9GAST|nr:hypothetical protein RRG08_000935 [Elysia crispata]